MMATVFTARLRAHARRIGWPGLAALTMLFAALGVVFIVAPQQERAVSTLRADANAARDRALRAVPVAQAGAAEVDPAVRFERAFPTAEDRHDRVAALLSLARQQGLVGAQSEYRFQPEPGLGLARYRVVLPLAGSYGALRNFIGQALRDDPALALDSVRLRRTDPQASLLQAELQFSLLMRADPSAPPARVATVGSSR